LILHQVTILSQGAGLRVLHLWPCSFIDCD